MILDTPYWECLASDAHEVCVMPLATGLQTQPLGKRCSSHKIVPAAEEQAMMTRPRGDYEHPPFDCFQTV